MKKFTLLSAALVAAMGANAQMMIDWNDEGKFVFMPKISLLKAASLGMQMKQLSFATVLVKARSCLNLMARQSTFLKSQASKQ